MVIYTGGGLVVKRPGGSLVKSPDAESCLGGGGLFPSAKLHPTEILERIRRLEVKTPDF